MNDLRGLTSPASVAVVVLALLAVLLTMREAQPIVVPVIMAFFLAVVAEPPVAWLQRKKVSRVVAIVGVVSGMAAILFLIGLIVGSSLQELSANLPEYQALLQTRLATFMAAWPDSSLSTDAAAMLNGLSPDEAIHLASSLLSSLSELFSNAFLIFALMIFIMLEMPVVQAKLTMLGGSHSTFESMNQSVQRYLAIKTVTSLATGVVVGLLLLALGVDFAILWGLLAFLLNYVPNIGSILAAVPATLLALLQDGPAQGLLVAAIFVVVNMVIGNVIEPRVMGAGLGLSPLVVFLSLITWGWILGPVGMLLSVPLTTTIKLALDSRESTRPLALLLGAEVPEMKREGGVEAAPSG